MAGCLLRLHIRHISFASCVFFFAAFFFTGFVDAMRVFFKGCLVFFLNVLLFFASFFLMPPFFPSAVAWPE